MVATICFNWLCFACACSISICDFNLTFPNRSKIRNNFSGYVYILIKIFLHKCILYLLNNVFLFSSTFRNSKLYGKSCKFFQDTTVNFTPWMLPCHSNYIPTKDQIFSHVISTWHTRMHHFRFAVHLCASCSRGVDLFVGACFRQPARANMSTHKVNNGGALERWISPTKWQRCVCLPSCDEL